jgi:hypothetical protein
MKARWSVLALSVAFAGSARAEKLTIDADTFVNIAVLIQPQITATEGASPSGDVATDFFLRRGRLVLAGQIDPKISFVFITDQANWGRGGDFSAPFLIQDALASYKVAPELTLSAGFLLLPFLRHNYTSAGALNGLDFHAAVIRFPAGRAFRDMGVEARGLLLDNKIYYRAGVFNGVAGRAATMMTPDVNRHDAPRAVGTVRYNILGKEDGYAFPGIYFAKEPIVNVGVGVDWQQSIIGADERRYLAYMVDAFADYPFAPDRELVAHAAIIGYRHYQSGSARDNALAWYLEGGFRFGKVEPVASVEYFNGTAPGTKLTTFRIGFNLWVSEHKYNVKTELAIPRQEAIGDASVDNQLVGTLQVQSQF